MNQEVIEYRIQSNQQNQEHMTALILFSVAFATNALGSSVMTVAGGALFGIAGVFYMTHAKALDQRGYCRAVWAQFVHFPDPPLEEWVASLEAADAFAVSNGQTNGVIEDSEVSEA